MSAPARPANEAERLALLQSYGILDSEPEPGFDDIARLASLICDTPIAVVSLVDEHRQWFKSRVGLPLQETSRDASFCAHAIVTPQQPLIVHDTLRDPRFIDNPLVTGDPNIRFYAGVPLVLENGHAVGTLCVLDRSPRDLTPSQLEGLELLARQVASEMRRRKHSGVARPSPEKHSSRPAHATALQVGVVAGRYRVDEVLGVGGMGLVVGATDLATKSPVAVKFILPEVSGEEVVARFIREARTLIRLSSVHVTQILDVGNLGNGAPFIVMERLEGEDLEAVIEARAPLPFDEAIGYLLQACAGVAHVHAAGILHRDLKPSNLFLARRPGAPPVLKILDFGIAKLGHGEDREPSDRSAGLTMVGSPCYMAPEQMSFAADLDERSDVWSLGVVLYELLTSHRPFDGATSVEICLKVVGERPVAMRTRRPEMPPALDRIVERCLAKDPVARYASVTELADDLTAIKAGLAIS